MAEALANKYFDFEVSSAGTRVPTEGPGKQGTFLKDIPVAEPVLRCLKEIEDIDIGEYKNKQLAPEMLENNDRIFVMAEKETIPVYLRDHSNVEYWNILDPLHNPYEFYCKTLGQIKQKLLASLSDQN